MHWETCGHVSLRAYHHSSISHKTKREKLYFIQLRLTSETQLDCVIVHLCQEIVRKLQKSP
jgi:hypothetical protein